MKMIQCYEPHNTTKKSPEAVEGSATHFVTGGQFSVAIVRKEGTNEGNPVIP